VTIDVIVKDQDLIQILLNAVVVVMIALCKGEPLLLTEENMGWIKKQWKKFIDWIFDGFL
jgi:hypothetical protein